MLALFGGSWNNGSSLGVSAWPLFNSSASADVNIGRQTLVSSLKYFHPIILTAW